MCKPIRVADLHDLTDRKQVGHSDVISAQKGLSAEEHGLQFVQSVVKLRQCTNQTPLVHRGAGLSWDEHLRHRRVETDRQV